MQLEHKPKKSDITISFEYYGSILEYFHEFRINREEIINFLFDPRQKKAPVQYIYCKISNNSNWFYTSINMTTLRSMCLATHSIGTVKFFFEAPRNLNGALDSVHTHSTFTSNILHLMCLLQFKL